MILHQSRFATPWSLLVWDRCFPYLNISEIPIQFIWERPEIEVLVLYLVVIDLHSRLGGIRPARCVTPALPPPPSPRFRPRGVSKGPDYSNALRCARTPVPCVKTTCRVRRRPWDLSLRILCKSINTYKSIYFDICIEPYHRTQTRCVRVKIYIHNFLKSKTKKHKRLSPETESF